VRKACRKQLKQAISQSNIFTFNVPIEIDREEQCECEHHLGQASLADLLVPGIQEQEMINSLRIPKLKSRKFRTRSLEFNL